MKEWKKALIAFGPLLVVLWLFIGLMDNFKIATISLVSTTVLVAVVMAWIYFVFDILDKKDKEL